MLMALKKRVSVRDMREPTVCCRMTAGANRWPGEQEIVMRHLTRQTESALSFARVTRPLEDLPMQNAAILDSIYRYPVKGLSPEPYQRVLLRTGQTLPTDRRYAIENGPSSFDPAGAEMAAEGVLP